MSAVPGTPAPAAGTQAAQWSAKLLLTFAGVLLIGAIVWYARTVTVPFIVALLVCTQLVPLVTVATRHGIPRGLAITAAMLLVLVVVVGLTWLFAAALFGNLGDLGPRISEGADDVIAWLQDNNQWIRQNEEQIRKFLEGILPAAKGAADGLLSTVLFGLSLAAQLASAAFLGYVFILYVLTGGDGIWRWVQERFHPANRARVQIGGEAAWNAATGYIRGIALVALIDSVVIAIGMLVLGTPMVGTLFLLSFVSLFIPILGAWVSGAVIVLVTLGSQGFGPAVAMTAVILIAQQLDSMFVTPLVYQQTVNLNPIVTLSGVIIGSQLLGIVGAFLAVPMIAVGWAVYSALERPPEDAVEATAPG